jgi:predicted transcriptional regulator
MSHMISVPDELYERIAALAMARGESVERVVEHALSEGLSEGDAGVARPLDWETASADEIIADLRASRVERERPFER